MEPFRVALAPNQLWQAINPWTVYNQGGQIGLVNISLGQSNNPDVEREVLDKVGSYGLQLGRIGDALDVLINHFDQSTLAQPEKDALAILTGQLAKIRQVKQRVSTTNSAD